MGSEKDSYTGAYGREQKYQKYRTSKSRRNYQCICIKFDCINRDKMCDKCIRYSEYGG